MLLHLMLAVVLAYSCTASKRHSVVLHKESLQLDPGSFPEKNVINNKPNIEELVAVLEQERLGGLARESSPEDDREKSLHVVKRAKRNLIIPGTNWCGPGNVSRNNSEVGEVASTDRCCKHHDHCPYTIDGFSTKYSMFNYRFYTLSHCECDDIFRTCLRMAASDQANLIGELFFNVLGMKCFVFKRETVCAQRTWWGKCERERTQHVAEMRDPREY